jgi:hypothetical protein
MGFLLLNKVREEHLPLELSGFRLLAGLCNPFRAIAREPPARFTQRLCHFFLSDFQSSYPIVQDILYKEEEGIRYFPTGVRLVSAFIHLSIVDEGSFGRE